MMALDVVAISIEHVFLEVVRGSNIRFCFRVTKIEQVRIEVSGLHRACSKLLPVLVDRETKS